MSPDVKSIFLKSILHVTRRKIDFFKSRFYVWWHVKSISTLFENFFFDLANRFQLFCNDRTQLFIVRDAKMKGRTHLGKVQLFPLKIGGHGVLSLKKKRSQYNPHQAISFAGFKQRGRRILKVPLRGLMGFDDQWQNYVE